MSIESGYAVLRQVFEHRLVNTNLWAAEFGVYSGYSLRVIAENMPVFGFDSFKGLPEDWREGFPAGSFNAEGVFPGPGLSPTPDSLIIPGWFKDTVPGFRFPPLGLVHIDSDLYSSAVTALWGVADAIGPGTVIVFDEMHGYEGWEEHEWKAWSEFMTEYKITATLLAAAGEEVAYRIESMR